MLGKKLAIRFVCLTFVLLITPLCWCANELFQEPKSFRSEGTYALSIGVGDLNGDGNADLAVADGCFGDFYPCDGGVGVLLGNGDGSFQTVRTYYSGGYYANSIAIGDVNSDDKPDLLVGNWRTGPYNLIGLVGVLLGNGDGTFQAAQTYSAAANDAKSITLADVNGDRKSDVIVLTESGDQHIGVLLGNGDGSFQPSQTYLLRQAGFPQSVAIADLNVDGKPDLVVGFACGPNTGPLPRDQCTYGVVAILMNNGDGSFRETEQLYHSGGKYENSLAVSDVNEDKKLDLIVGSRCSVDGCGHGGVISVRFGNGDGTFSADQNYAPGSYQTNFIAVGDANSDGRPDVFAVNSLVGNYGKKVGVLLGRGDGSFEAAQLYPSGDGLNSLVLADVNRDGRSDLLVANSSCGGERCVGEVSVFLGRFNTITTVSSSSASSFYGQSVTLTAEVSSTNPIQPTGTVSFRTGSKGLGKATLAGGVATIKLANLPAGTATITAFYSGDVQSIKSTSKVFSQVIEPALTTTTIRASVNPSAQGQPVTFVAKVASPTKRITGTITFKANGEPVGTVPLVGETASITTSVLPDGANWITAFYIGTSNVASSRASLTQTVH